MVLSTARKAAMAAVAVAALGGVSFFGASASVAASGTAGRTASAPAPMPTFASAVAKGSVSAHRQTPRVVTQVIGKGRMDGHRWSVALEFHRTLPKGYTLPTLPDGTTTPGTSLLCQRMYIGGVRVDHQGGPWSDCQPVTGTNDPRPAGETGLWGLHDKGIDGSRLMVADPEPGVAYGLITLADGHRIKATTVTVPGTTYRAWAAAVPDGQTIAVVDQYDNHNNRLTHDTNWR
ncbi:hypothetical protein [Streptomyces sp. WP-1]|uniref:hypothetical protein n=1 Tax=Streptomyces sp. WP-1 TaxID=3041497 RepID=UPI00264A05DE|nr:hypothetical protein [Streptomyces sp. WP-1]WKE70233.1 hypothetical protein QHG49_14875 [Streptomyces sp. WP-1]